MSEVSAFELASTRAQGAETAVALSASDRGVFLGDGFDDAPYSEQRISEIGGQRLVLQAELDSKRESLSALSRRIADERLRVGTSATFRFEPAVRSSTGPAGTAHRD